MKCLSRGCEVQDKLQSISQGKPIVGYVPIGVVVISFSAMIYVLDL